jgi:tyrosyl-tRNA synthetase
VGLYARLCTALHPREVDELEAAVQTGGAAANAAKRAMARAVVALYHGADGAAAAEEQFDAVFKRGEVPADVPEAPLPEGDPLHLPAVLVGAGLASSTSAARRDIDAGAVRIDGVSVPAKRYDVARAELAGAVLANGKRRVARLV